MAMYDSQPVSLADIITHDDPDPHQHLDMHPNDFEHDHTGGEEQLDLQTFFVRALYDYQSTDASSLSFRRGALIEVLTQLESGWWDGLLGEERGWFPSNYVELLSDEEAEAELNARDQAAAQAAATTSNATTASNILSHGQVGGNQGTQDWMDDRSQALSPSTRGVNGTGAARADDYWVPQVTSSGQVFFVNTRTGEQSSEIPTTNHDPLATESQIPVAPQLHTSQSAHQIPTQQTMAPLVRSRSDTYDTTASASSVPASASVASSSIPTPTPGSAGFGVAATKDDGVQAPWVRGTADEGAYFYMNQETGQIRWSAPSPVMGGGKALAKLPTLMDTDESDWSAHDTYASTRGIAPDIGLSASLPSQMRRLSVYSDDSEVRPLDPSSPHIRPGHMGNDRSASSGSPHRTDGTSNQDPAEHDHENTSQPTSTASMPVFDGPSGESLARQLQELLTPPATERIESLSNDVREAISAVVEAVGSPATPPPPGQPTVMAQRVATVVTSVRNLLYVSGTLSTPVANLHLSRQYTGSSGGNNYTDEALHESGRAPLIELKPFQRKVTATLSKLVLSARAADSNPDWPYDDATTRVDSDAGELERAVVSFVMEVKRLEILGGVVLAEKRLEGALISGDGLAGVGTAIYGAGSAGEWKGMGFVPTDRSEGQVFPQWSLAEDVLSELRSIKAVVDDGLEALSENEIVVVESVVPRIRHVLSHLHAFLNLAEDIDLARNLDVDGILYPSANPVDSGVIDEYINQVHAAQRLLRKLENDKQAVYDEGSSVWAFTQALFADPIAVDSVDMSLAVLQDWDGRVASLRTAGECLNMALADTMECYLALWDVARRQEDGYRRGIRASMGHRDGQISPAQRHRLSTAALNVPGSSMDSNFGSNLDMTLNDLVEGDEDVVDVGFALGRSKVKAHQKQPSQTYGGVVQLQAPVLPGHRTPSPQKGWPSVGSFAPSGSGALRQGRHGHNGSVSTAAPTYQTNEKDGDGTSTIRQSTDMPPPGYADEEDDDDDDDDLNFHPARKMSALKSPSRAAKITKIFGDDAPAHYLATQNAQQAPWYLRTDTDDKSILINPDGGVRGGTLKALVERLSLHNYRDAVYNDTFLITFKSFTTVDELFDLLVERFNIREPDGLKPEERAEWVEKKQTPIRFRVINILRSMLMETHVLEKEDMHILDRIKTFAMSVADVVPPAKQLILLVERASNGEIGRVTKHTATSQPPQSLLPKSGRITKILEVDPLEMARQLTIMESKLYLKIRPMECLARAKDQQGEDDSIKKIIGTSNKIASWVAQQVLSKDDPRKRAAIIRQFVTVAEKCRDLRNFSSMAALIAGLNSPPIRRLKRTWELLNARVTGQLDDVEKTLDSGRNFTGYRALLATVDPPCIPFLGVYLTTLTFIQDGNKDMLSKDSNMINFNKRQKAAEVIREIKKYQSRPYNLHELPNVQEFIESSLSGLENAPDFWELSMQLEPREREDEKMARLLQESGFL